MIIFPAILASVAAVALAFFAYKKGVKALSATDAPSVFVYFPILFAGWALSKSNPWLAWLAILLVTVGWAYAVKSRSTDKHTSSARR